MDPEAMRSVATAAARRGGEVIRGADPSTPETRAGTGKGLPGDWVSAVDLASEEAIRAYLADATPHVPMHGEETGGADAGLRWLVDPLDGTTNFLHGFPAVGVSVALVEEDRVRVGAVHAPFLSETWHAVEGGPAVHEGPSGAGACRVAERPATEAVVATGFPFRRKERLPRYLAAMERALRTFEDLRRPGAACLDLAWVASGVFDGFFELGLAPWDVAAGALLVQAAGGVVTDWSGGDGFLTGDILAGSPQVHEHLRRLEQPDDHPTR